MSPEQLHPLVAVPVLGGVLSVLAYLVAVADVALGDLTAGDGVRLGRAAVEPFQRARAALTAPGATTERPDLLLWVIAPAAYGGVAALAAATLPLADGVVVADVRTGIVVFGAAEVLAMVAVYLHGWASNSPFALVGGYRFLAQALSFLLISMFVLIAAALPAESMSFGRIVAAQQDLWNVVKQPLGLPLFLIVALGVSFWGPLDTADGPEIAGGTSAESAGPAAFAWQAARRAMLGVYALASAVVFLGGHLGPWLPGPVWLLLKTGAVLAVLVWLGHQIGRVPIDRFVSWAWTIFLPASFLHLAQAGVVALG